MRFLCWVFGHRIIPTPIYVTLTNCQVEVHGAPMVLHMDPYSRVCLRCGKTL